ncbi:fungal-specific transcription factor domain-containing protein [Xylogone sp. PMI_703]|nr:fungal-specific transcription factor domain-containing protein [Xylogone sp. PMI_703]
MQDISIPRRRKGRDVVTQNACDECKRRKARCDGQNPCARCASRDNLTCHYTLSVRASKDALRAEIESLQNQQSHSDQILHALASGLQSDSILQQLRDGETLEKIAQRLPSRQSGSVETRTSTNSPAKSIGSSTKSVLTDLRSLGDRPGSDIRVIEASGSFQDGMQTLPSHNPHAWSTVINDPELVEHLIALYFCWEYPSLSSLSKEHFMQDFEVGRQRYCSPLIVSIMCALGCRFSDRPIVSEISPTGQDLGSQFYDEAYALWETERIDPSLTTIQATVLMSLWKTSRGKNNWGSFYSRQAITMAVEMGLHLQTEGVDPSEAEYAVRSTTFWGAFVLDQAWSLTAGHSPYLSGQTLKLRPLVVTDDDATWSPYTDDGIMPNNLTSQRSNTVSIFRYSCELSIVFCRSLHMLYSSPLSLKSLDVLNIYTEYLECYNSMPSVLRKGEDTTPSVLFLHIYYHFAILRLFAPFINLHFLGSDLAAKEICVDAASAIGSIIGTYRQLYTLRRTPSFVPYISLASSIVHIVTAAAGITDAPESIQGTLDLQEMAPCHIVAVSSVKTLQHIASLSGTEEEKVKRKIAVSPNLMVKLPVHFFSPEMRKTKSSPLDLIQECSIFAPFPSQLSPFAGPDELRLNGFEKDPITINVK